LLKKVNKRKRKNKSSEMRSNTLRNTTFFSFCISFEAEEEAVSEDNKQRSKVYKEAKK
jgi:hypothetical protein